MANVEEQFDGSGYAVTVCDAAYAGEQGRCDIAGVGTAIHLKGIVISQDRILVGGEISIDKDGRITDVGCSVPKGDSVVLDCPGVLISPGFINLHEHIEYSYEQPPSPPTPRWEHRNQWRAASPAERGFDYSAPKDEGIRAEVSERAMLRHMLSGTTAVVGANDYSAFVRNLKKTNIVLGTPSNVPVMDETFPLQDVKSSDAITTPCSASTIASIRRSIDARNPYVAHVGEGINQGAGYEVDCMLESTKVKTTPNAFVHVVAVTPEQITRLVGQHTSVVLSPRSNFQLYGATASIPALQQAGVNLALGTDWAPSGSLTMLDEMRCLAVYNKRNLSGYLTWADIHRMATRNAARAVGLEGQLGSLSPGRLADMALIDAQGRRSLGEVLARAADKETLAVFIAGKGASFPSSWTEKLPGTLENCQEDPRALCGEQRMICGAANARPLAALLALKTYVIDDAKLCRPQPTDDCVPVRPGLYSGIPTSGDRDGDGVPDSNDSCPSIFNPPLPFLGGKQSDMAALGEVCRSVR